MVFIQIINGQKKSSTNSIVNIAQSVVKSSFHGLCMHLLNSMNSSKLDMDLYPPESWSITVAALKRDVTRIILTRFQIFLDNVSCKLGIACLERGDKENNLHLQAAAEIKWNRTESKALCKKFEKI